MHPDGYWKKTFQLAVQGEFQAWLRANFRLAPVLYLGQADSPLFSLQIDQ